MPKPVTQSKDSIVDPLWITESADSAPSPKRVGVPRGSDEDVWSTTKTADYDPDEFYIRSTNTHDHRSQQRVNLPPAIQAAVQEVVNSGEWPYRTTHDFFRDAIVHRMHYLKAMGWSNKTVEELLHVERAQAAIAMTNIMNAQRQELIDDAVKVINTLRISGDHGELIQMLAHFDGVADQLSAPWDEKLRMVCRNSGVDANEYAS